MRQLPQKKEVVMSTILSTFTQWCSRPDDQRFVSLKDLYDYCYAMAENTRTFVAKTDSLTFTGTIDENGKYGPPNSSVMLMQSKGIPGTVFAPQHWSFQQICKLAGAGRATGFLRSTHPYHAAEALQYNMVNVASSKEYRFYVTNGDNPDPGYLQQEQLRAVNGVNYGRVYDHEVVGAVRDVMADMGTPWVVPGIDGRPLDRVGKENTTLYASDRDCYLFLCDEETPITVPRPDGGTEDLFRGFIMSNSEVGNGSIRLTTLLYRSVCANRMIWGAQDVKEMRIRHAKGAPERFRREGVKMLREYAASTLSETRDTLRRSMTTVVGNNDEEVALWLSEKGFDKAQAESIVKKATEEEGQARTVWDLVQGSTAMARSINYAGARVAAETKASRLFEHAA